MNGKEDNYGDELGRKVYDLTGQGKLWGRGGAITWSRLRYWHLESLGRAGEGASAFSSTYYTAWGNAVSQVRRAPILSKMPWLVRGIWCAIWALSWSNFAEREIGLENMSHGQLDIRGSILAKWRRHRVAKRYLQEALSRHDITNDSRALILCKLGEVLDKTKKEDKNGGFLFGEALLLKDVKNTTRVRVLKALGKHMLRKKRSRPLDYKIEAMSFLKQALEIAERDNLGDQIVKIKALMRKVK